MKNLIPLFLLLRRPRPVAVVVVGFRVVVVTIAIPRQTKLRR